MEKENVVHSSITIIFSTFDSNSTKKKNTIPGYEKRDFPIAAVLSMEGYTCQNDVMFVS